MLGLHCCVGFSLVAEGRGYPLVVVQRLLTVVASLLEELAEQLWHVGSLVAAPGL